MRAVQIKAACSTALKNTPTDTFLLTEKRAEIVGCFLLHFNGLELAVVNVDLQKVVAEKNIPFA